MREFLFRGKREDNGEWIIRDNIAKCAYEVDDETKELIEVYSYYLNGVVVDAKTVGQYTGLTDKNGKKIFEGDILRTGTRMGYILFEKGCFRFRWKNFDKYRDDFFKTCIITEHGSFRELEVIGNIHDNPELLKGGASDA